MVEEILENLISQFTDPLTFYRELIQNALDAGSNMVSVQVTWREEPPAAIIDVTDYGEGMNRDIIRDELTRLFSSTKEDDFTKIGKFGIGFVSVFAIQPELVVVDTGRDGESWRVVFDGSPTYKTFRLDQPVEGTRVRLYSREMARPDFDDFVRRSRDRISFWCRYSDSPITFNGEAINQALTIDSPLVVRHSQPGTEVVMGVTDQTPPVYGLYNRGLTLTEGQRVEWPGLAFRMKSRYLEHTLTRDSVMLDTNYHKAFKILHRVASQMVPQAFFDRMSALLSSHDGAAMETLMAASGPYLSAWRKTVPRAHRDQPLFPTLHGPALSLNQVLRVARREGALYAQTTGDRVTEALAAISIPVLRAEPDSGMASAAAAITGHVPHRACEQVAAPLWCDDGEARERLELLAPGIDMLLSSSRVSCREMVLSEFNYPGSSVTSRPFLLQPDMTEPIRLYRSPSWWQWPLTDRLLFNTSHPLVVAALSRAHDAPLLSAYSLAKAVLLHYSLTDRLDARLLSRALSSRPRPAEGWLDHLRALLSGRVR